MTRGGAAAKQVSEESAPGRQKYDERLRRSRPRLLARPDAVHVPQEDGEIQTRRLHEIALENVLTPAERRPTRAAVIEYVQEAPLAELPAVPHEPAAAPAPQGRVERVVMLDEAVPRVEECVKCRMRTAPVGGVDHPVAIDVGPDSGIHAS